VNADTFVRAWKEKLGEKPHGEPAPRRLDYLLVRAVRIRASGMVTLGDENGYGSDHRLVWADVSWPAG
jgi:endonuclease/exonuclease/phosphatase family metal-dependent hydrolase